MCRWGDTVDVEVTIPADLSYTGEQRRTVKAIDRCIAPMVKALDAAGVLTGGSCCGHGRQPASVVFADGRELPIVERAGYRYDADVCPFVMVNTATGRCSIWNDRTGALIEPLGVGVTATCPDCGGSGRLYTSGWDDEGFPCPPCNGTGEAAA